MEFILENILNLAGFIIGIIIGVFAYVGYKNTGSPVLFRLTIAFVAIGIGFGIIWAGYMIDDIFFQEGKINRGLQALGLGTQTIGYFCRINENDLIICSMFIADNTNNGRIPTDLKYRDFGKNDFIVCENAMKK